MSTNHPDKCAHPSCACSAVKDSKFCSTFCEGASANPDIICNCGHAACSEHHHLASERPAYPSTTRL